jgi:hypothetical protein
VREIATREARTRGASLHRESVPATPPSHTCLSAGPVALRPRLTTGLPLSKHQTSKHLRWGLEARAIALRCIALSESDGIGRRVKRTPRGEASRSDSLHAEKCHDTATPRANLAATQRKVPRYGDNGKICREYYVSVFCIRATRVAIRIGALCSISGSTSSNRHAMRSRFGLRRRVVRKWLSRECFPADTTA